MDSLGISVKHTEKDTILFQAYNFEKTVVKDSTFSLYTYFLFKNNRVNRRDILDLLEEE